MKWSLKKGAAEFGLDFQTLAKRLQARGHELGRGCRYTTIDIMDAVVGNLEKEKIRLTRNQADVAELDRGERLGVLVPKESNHAAIASVLLPLRSMLMGMPSAVAPLCTDPEVAMTAIDTEVKRILKTISDLDVVAEPNQQPKETQ